MMFGTSVGRVFGGVTGNWTVKRWFRVLLGLLFFAVNTFGMVEKSLAITAGVTCAAVDDSNSGEIGVSADIMAHQILRSDLTCSALVSGIFVGNISTASHLLTPLLNTNNDGIPIFMGGLRIDYFAASITEVRVDGALYGSGNTIGTATTAGAFSHIVQYDYGGNTYHFTASKDANSNTLKAFTVVAGAAPVITGGATAAVNAVENQTAVTDVQSTDSDGDTEGAGLTYTLTGGADQAKFSIDANTGILTFVTAPNFETPTDAGGNNVYDVQVTVTDSGGLTDVQDIAVTVTDVDETVTAATTPATDTTSPSVAITAPTSTDGLTPFSITVQFSETVTGFVLADITVGNGSASGFVAVDGDTYTATITPTGKGDVTIDVAANVAVDAASNANTAAAQVTVKNTVVEDTQRTVATFMHNRAYHILSNQPKISGLLNGSNLGGGGALGNLDVDGNDNNLRLSFSSSLSRMRQKQKSKADKRIDNAFPNALPVESASSTYGEAHNFDVWTEVYGSSARAGNSDSDLWVGYLGAHYFVTPDMIVGALVQVDWASETNKTANSSADGTGWMVGPYIAGRITGTKLSYEARVAWGRSENDVTPNGNYTDQFETERFLASGKVSGSYRLGQWTLAPQASISWFEEDQEAYTDTLGNLIPQQTVSLGEYSFGPSFTYDIKLEDGTLLQPSFGISGVQNFGIQKGILTQGTVLGSEELRAKLEAGINITNLLGWGFAFTGFYDGIGLASYDAYGGSVRLTIPLN